MMKFRAFVLESRISLKSCVFKKKKNYIVAAPLHGDLHQDVKNNMLRQRVLDFEDI